MKKILCLSFFVMTIVAADENDKEISPENGLYVGIGLENSSNQFKLNLNAFPTDGGGYKHETLDFSKSKNNTGGHFFLGYKNYQPLFWAIETRFSIKKAEINKTYYDYYEPPSILTAPANLKMENGNNISVLAKLGGSLFSKRSTQYVLIGFSYGKLSFEFNYLPAHAMGGGNRPDDYAYYSSNRSVSKDILNIVYGLGLSYAIDNKTDFILEYYCKNHRSSKYTTAVHANLDQAGFPRTYRFRNTQHCISIAISRNIAFNFSIFAKN